MVNPKAEVVEIVRAILLLLFVYNYSFVGRSVMKRKKLHLKMVEKTHRKLET